MFMAKVMIIDDGLVARVKSEGKNEKFWGVYDEDTVLKMKPYLDREANDRATPYNLSSVSGSKHELYLSRFPIVPVHNSNFFSYFRDAEGQDYEPIMKGIARKNFDINKILEEVGTVNPDFLFVDLGLPYLAENSFVNDFLSRGERISPKYHGWPPIEKFFNVAQGDSVSYREKAGYNKAFNAYLKNLNPDFVRKLVGTAGGVAVGDALMKENVPFSFWTGDIGHAVNSLVAAEMYGLVSENDISSAIESYFESFHNGEERVFPISNRRGNILFEGKGSLLDDSGILERAVEAVEDFQGNCRL